MVVIEVECWPLNEFSGRVRELMKEYIYTETRVFLIDPHVYESAPITRWTLEVEDFFTAQEKFAQADVVRQQIKC
jgi:hypothetical protein